MRSIVALLTLSVVALAEDVTERNWKPSQVIDASDAVVVASISPPPRKRSIAPAGKDSIGFIMELDVSRSLSGTIKGGEKIVFFQPAGGLHGFQHVIDDEFVAFLRLLSPGEKNTLKKITDINATQDVWTLTDAREQWRAYYPVKPYKGDPGYSLLKHKLAQGGVTVTAEDAVAYIRDLISLRKGAKGHPAITAGKIDPFQTEVITTDEWPKRHSAISFE